MLLTAVLQVLTVCAGH